MASVLGLLGTDSGYHAASALVRDGELVAFCEEERFSGNKGGFATFPTQSARWCLEQAGLLEGGLDVVAFGWDCNRYRAELPATFLRHHIKYRDARRAPDGPRGMGGGEDGWLRGAVWLATHRPGWVRSRIAKGLQQAGYGGDKPPVRFFPHHRCHAATAFLCSGFERAAILTMDGSGEDIATAAWIGEGLGLRKLWSLPLPHSLGWFYSAFTEYLGFRHSRHEGKVMGLAAYGKPVDSLRETMAEVLRLETDGMYRLDPSWGKYGFRSWGEHYSDRVVAALGPPRRPHEPLTQAHKDLAWAVQDRLETAVAGLVGKLLRETGTRNLCLAGGVAMNCKLNGTLKRAGLVDGLFIQPASDDSGAALGAALLGAQELGDDPRFKQRHAYYGPGYDADEIKNVVESCGLKAELPEDLPEAAARLVAQGRVVGWFQGRQEVGARALGHRSILANPRVEEMRDRVNLQVKLREPWRPYCPSMTAPGAEKVLGAAADLPFMIEAAWVRDEVAAELPSVVHVDGSARPQTVDPAVSPAYHALIEAVGRHTDWPVVLNTSFNVRGKPMVLTPRDALGTYFSTGMDALALGPFLLQKVPS